MIKKLNAAAMFLHLSESAEKQRGRSLIFNINCGG
jgi:hypothetical protein